MLIAPDDEGCQSFVVVVAHVRPVVGVWLHGSLHTRRLKSPADRTCVLSAGLFRYVSVGVCPALSHLASRFHLVECSGDMERSVEVDS